MTRAARSTDPDDPRATGQPKVSDLIRAVTRIKQLLRDNLAGWEDDPPSDPENLDPFIQLRSDIRTLRRSLKEPALSALKKRADNAVMGLLDDDSISALADAAFLSLSAYVNLYNRLAVERHPLWDESYEPLRGLQKVCEDLGPLQEVLDRLAPGGR